MKSFISFLVLFFLLQLVINALPGHHVLEPVSDDGWPSLEHHRKKRDVSQAMSLQEMEHFVWGTKNGGGVFANMSLGTNENELVISMERFAHTLLSVNCSENMMMEFNSNASYKLAIDNWSWVNFHENRTFILIANYPGCGTNTSRQPWVISNVNYNDANLAVYLNGTMRSWKEVAHTYSLDFGRYSPPTTNLTKRLDIPNPLSDIKLPKFKLPQAGVTKSFSIPLSQTIPVEFFKQESFGSSTFGIECVDCGLRGTLEMTGHVESGISGLSAFTISAVPQNIATDLALKMTATGSIGGKSGTGWNKQFHLLTAGIPGFTIPDILTVGPNIEIDAGFAISEISGDAVVTSGIMVDIPGSSEASVDFVGKKKLDVTGWIPNFTTKPLVIDAQVDAEVEVFVQASLAVSLECLGNGFNLDLGLKLPEINIQAEAKYDTTTPPCAKSGKPGGVSIDSSAGATLLFQAYEEVESQRNYFVNEPLFDKPNAFTFPHVCVPFGTQPKATGVLEINGKDGKPTKMSTIVNRPKAGKETATASKGEGKEKGTPL